MEIRRPWLRRIETQLFLHISGSPISCLSRCHMRHRIELIGSASECETIQHVIPKPVRRCGREPRGRRVEWRSRRCYCLRRKRGGDHTRETWNPSGQSLNALVGRRRRPPNNRTGQCTGYRCSRCHPRTGTRCGGCQSRSPTRHRRQTGPGHRRHSGWNGSRCFHPTRTFVHLRLCLRRWLHRR